MNRPDVPQLDALEETSAEIDALEERIGELKETLTQQAMSLDTISDGPTRLAAAGYAYWLLPRVSSLALAWAMFKTKDVNKLRELIGPMKSTLACEDCGTALTVTSRTEIQGLLKVSGMRHPQRSPYQPICPECRKKTAQKRTAYSKLQSDAYWKRVRELNAMPYSEFLRTDDWRRIRAHAIDMAGFKNGPGPPECEICEDQREIEVYHKSLERKGQAYDLMLLCPSCRDMLAANRKIVMSD